MTDSGGNARLDAYADLSVRVGANVQPGQEVFVLSLVEHVPLARALARSSYRAGASYVHVLYRDEHVRRSMIELGGDEALTHSPGWLKTLTEAQAGQALIATSGDPEPDLLADLDGARVGRARMKEIAEIRRRQFLARSVNWCIVASPGAGWAKQVFGEPDVERLWDAVAFCMRLDEPDPVAAWREHLDRLATRAEGLNELGPDALRYRGPGTDLTVGLLPNARWMTAAFRTATGIDHVANMPTEEVFTTPDWRRADGTIRSTRPLALRGRLIEGLQLTFVGGAIVGVEAERGAEVVQAELAPDERAVYLGELALVDGSSRVGQTGTTFYDTLFDENATCHIAYGAGIANVFDGEPGEWMNDSTVHTDFMVGGPQVEVDAVLADGTVVPLLRDEAWQL
jgi:aminopeptidase